MTKKQLASTTLCSCSICKSGKCGVCRDVLYGNEGMKVLDHGLIQSEQDIMKLNIVDWKRHRPWPDPQAAMKTIFSFFNQVAHYTILEDDMNKCPKRNDFPGWNHVGGHEEYGRLYWNWFQYWHGEYGELSFSDCPDFYGKFDFEDGTNRFWGDVGQCSPLALALTQKQMSIGDVWVSIRSPSVQIVIEPFVDLFEVWDRQCARLEQEQVNLIKGIPVKLPSHAVIPDDTCMQMSMF